MVSGSRAATVQSRRPDKSITGRRPWNLRVCRNADGLYSTRIIPSRGVKIFVGKKDRGRSGDQRPQWELRALAVSRRFGGEVREMTLFATF